MNADRSGFFSAIFRLIFKELIVFQSLIGAGITLWTSTPPADVTVNKENCQSGSHVLLVKKKKKKLNVSSFNDNWNLNFTQTL